MFDVMGRTRRMRRLAMRRLPAMRRRRSNRALVATPIVAVAGVATVAGLLFWDERRRTAMRRRMEEVAGSVGSSVSAGLNRVAPAVPTGVGQD